MRAVPARSHRALIGWLVRYAAPSWRILLLLVPLTAAAAALNLLTAGVLGALGQVVLAGPVGDQRPPGGGGSLLDRLGSSLLPSGTLEGEGVGALALALCAAVLAIRLAGAGCAALTGALSMRAHAASTARLQQDVHEHMLRLPLASPRRLDSGQLQARLLHDAAQATGGFDVVVTTLAFSPLLLACYGALIVTTSPRVALVALLGAGLHAVVARATSRGLAPRVRETLECWSRQAQVVSESLRNARLVRATGTEERRQQAFREATVGRLAAQVRLGDWRALEEPARDLVNTLVRVAVVLVALGELLSGRVGLVGCGLLLYLGASMAAPLARLSALAPHLVRVLEAARRVRVVLDDASVPPPRGGQLAVFQRSLRLRGVRFRYEGAGWTLGPLDLELRPGEAVALVGPSGAGKSTVLDLVLGLVEPAGGVVELDGVPLAEVDRGSYQALFGVVPQDAFLFSGTLRENVAYARPDATPDEVLRAVRLAGLAEWVAGRPEGLEAVLGEGGACLSGGERQRVALARALLGRPRILLLDEATGALDPLTATRVEGALDELRGEVTVLFVSHRSSALQRADRALVLDRGQLIAAGTRVALEASCALYVLLTGSAQAREPLVAGAVGSLEESAP